MVAALIAALLSVPATAEAAPSPVAGEITTLKNELGRLIETQRQGPAPMDDQVATGMKENTEKAESQIASEPCQAADSLLAFARAGREQVRVLRDTIDGGGWNSDQLAQLTSTRTWLDRLGRQAGALRARIFTEIKSCEGPIDVYVDPVRAQPKGDSLPDDRPLASLTDSDGTSTDFVADELVVSTSEPSVLDAIVARYDGKVLNKVEQGDTMHYQVRIETKLAQPERLSDDLKAIDPDKTQAESVAVSSTAGLELLAAAASATSEKATVGVNWVGTSDDIPNSNTPEASSGPSGFSASGYDRNSYTWQYLNEGGPQDIGVTSAWTVLDSVGKLDNKIKAAVLDRGFDITADHPASSTVTSSVPGVSPSYQFSWEPRWHGTTVTDSMAAVPGNFIGTAGTAATVVRPTGVWTTGDMFYTMAAISQALAGGNKIINMSFSAAVPWYLAWSVLPFDGYTAFVRAVNDVLLFSSAGNDGKDVDATTGFIVKWEKAWHTPCENSGVTCVGGLAKNSLNRHADSNYGHEHVDIFAPYTVLAGPDPDNPSTSTARAKHGTSYATPYTAGVAALIWAANPGQSMDTVEDVLMRNRRPSPDSKIKNKVITALSAVQDALPATIKIDAPTNGSVLSPHSPTQFRASLWTDGHPLPATITWRRNGTVIGTGLQFQSAVPAGTHAITATAVFADGASTADVVTVSSVDHVPVVKVSGPRSTTSTPTFDKSELIPFHGTSQDDLGPLPESAMKWYLDNSTTPFATGHNPTINTGAAVGNHTVTLKGCDTAGQCGQETIPIVIQADGSNKPPVARVTNPANGTLLWVNGNDTTGWYHEITLNGTVTDPEGAPVTVKWFDNGVEIADTLQPTVRLRGGCGPYNHTLVLQARDNAGIVRQDQVTVTVSLVC